LSISALSTSFLLAVLFPLCSLLSFLFPFVHPSPRHIAPFHSFPPLTHRSTTPPPRALKLIPSPTTTDTPSTHLSPCPHTMEKDEYSHTMEKDEYFTERVDDDKADHLDADYDLEEEDDSPIEEVRVTISSM